MIFAQSYKNLSYLQKKKENFFSFIKEKQYLCTLINQKYDMPQSLHIAIIGGGAAGFFAAIEAKRNFPHADITISRRIRRFSPRWKSREEEDAILPIPLTRFPI